MKTTRLAGLAFDARHAAQLRSTLRIYTYAQRIRRIATGARSEPAVAAVPRPAPALPLDVSPQTRWTS